MDNRLTFKITQGTTLGLRRIMRFLKNNDEELNKNKIVKECNLGRHSINDKLDFLADFNLIKKRFDKKKGIYLYKINKIT